MSDKRRMGRPPQSDASRQKKVDRVIACAHGLFLNEGFDAVSMRKIAAEAGMGTMTLYKYFPNKNAILHHIWSDFFDELFDKIATDISKRRTPRNKLQQACLSYLEYWSLHKQRFQMVYLNEDRASSSDGFFVHHAHMEEKITNVFVPLLRGLDTFATADTPTLKAFIESLMCYLNGLALNTITISEYPWKPADRYLDLYLDAVLDN